MGKDTIYREDAIKALLRIDGIKIDKAFAMGEIRSVPSANKPQKVIAQITLGEEKLHEIVKEAVERFKEEYEITDRPQGEWINKGAVCQCTRCKGYSRGLLEEKNGKLCEPHKLIYPWFCPNCGARMREINNE